MQLCLAGRLKLDCVGQEEINWSLSKRTLYANICFVELLKNKAFLDRFTNSTTSRTEKLKLNFLFEGNSRQLPTKLHIEIKDVKGRTVFR